MANNKFVAYAVVDECNWHKGFFTDLKVAEKNTFTDEAERTIRLVECSEDEVVVSKDVVLKDAQEALGYTGNPDCQYPLEEIMKSIQMVLR